MPVNDWKLNQNCVKLLLIRANFLFWFSNHHLLMPRQSYFHFTVYHIWKHHITKIWFIWIQKEKHSQTTQENAAKEKCNLKTEVPLLKRQWLNIGESLTETESSCSLSSVRATFSYQSSVWKHQSSGIGSVKRKQSVWQKQSVGTMVLQQGGRIFPKVNQMEQKSLIKRQVFWENHWTGTPPPKKGRSFFWKKSNYYNKVTFYETRRQLVWGSKEKFQFYSSCSLLSQLSTIKKTSIK